MEYRKIKDQDKDGDGGGDDIETSRGKAHSVSNVDIERTKWKRKYVL